MIARQRDANSQGRRAPDLGSASVVMIAIAMVAALLGGTAVAVAAGAGAVARAQAAADLGALAAASAAREERAIGEAKTDHGCGLAQEVVSLHQAHLVSCAIDGAGIVEVAVSATVTGGVLGEAWNVERSAVAGPLGAKKIARQRLELRGSSRHRAGLPAITRAEGPRTRREV